MTSRCPAEPGRTLDQVETPALVLDLDAFARNLSRMEAELAGSGVRLRAHAKAHKCAEIARRQIAAGAVGVCCQKVSEAEALVEGGVGDVLVTNEIVSPAKLERLCMLARSARIAVLCDDAGVVPLLGAAATGAGVELDVLIEIEVGGRRCGIAPGEAAAGLARQIDAAPGLAFAGLQAYCGSAQHQRGHADRARMSDGVTDAVRMTRDALRAAGLDRDWVTGGGTGTYPFERDSGLFSEVQAGSYAFLDMDYAAIAGEDGAPLNTFEHSLFVVATVMSAAVPGHAVLDAGHKAHSMDSGLAGVFGRDDVTVTGQSDEHMTVSVGAGAAPLAIGDRLRLIPGHVDPTFNLHDWVVCVRGDRVAHVWAISARGPGL